MLIVEPYIWVLWDLLAVVIFFHSVQKCARRGFVSTIAGLLVYVAAAVIAYATYANIADFLYENVIHDVVRHVLTNSFSDMLSNVAGDADIVHSIPFVLRLMLGFKKSAVEAIPIDAADAMADHVIDLALETPLMSLLHGVGFLLMFTISAFFARWLSRVFTGINKLPVIGTLNVILGGIAGVLEGGISLLIGGLVLRLAVTFSDGVWWWLNESVIHSTYIWRLFY